MQKMQMAEYRQNAYKNVYLIIHNNCVSDNIVIS